MANDRRKCAAPDCSEWFEPGRSDQQYHWGKCRERVKSRRRRGQDPRGKPKPKDRVLQETLEGDVYRQLLDQPEWLVEVDEGLVGVPEIAQRMGVNASSVRRSLSRIGEVQRMKETKNAWTGPSPEALASLEDLQLFRDRYFRNDAGEPYTTKPFHREWMDAITEAVTKGSRLMVLSPPRHGKTELLLHYCIQQIVKNPQIRILWISSNGNLAKRWLGYVKRQFTENEQLIEDFLAPGEAYKPHQSDGLSWSRTAIEVRGHTTKSPNMVAVGAGEEILSMDTDLIVVDDLESSKTVQQPSRREYTRLEWWPVTVGSRKMQHTAWITIGSRQHPDDLYGYLLESEVWDCIVESAHSPECEKPELDIDSHTDCMLWPEMNPYSWLIDQLHDMSHTGGRAKWEMVYLNRPQAEGLMVFERPVIEACRNPHRQVRDYPQDCYLIAGLDPAATGYQAAFLWGYSANERKLYMVDLENEEGGGVKKARAQVAHWYDGTHLYCRHWIVEQNLYRGAIYQDEILQKYCRDNNIRMDPHHTGHNKWDQDMGVTSMQSWFETQTIDLPYKGVEAQSKTDLFIQQLIHFSQDANTRGRRNRHLKSDVVMASWFPFPHIKFLDRQAPINMDVEYKPSFPAIGDTPMFQYARPKTATHAELYAYSQGKR